MHISHQDRIQAKNTLNKFGNFSKKAIFYELCFCLCSPQTRFVSNQSANKTLRKINFHKKHVSKKKLSKILKSVRFYNNKTKYLLHAKKNWDKVLSVLFSNSLPEQKRESLVQLLKGLGYKTASHFLRNSLGISTLAIIDTHILKFLKSNKPKNKKEYLSLEKQFCSIAAEYKLTPAELDIIVFSKYSKVPEKNVR